MCNKELVANQKRMKRVTFGLICLILMFNNIVQSKKYLVEADDEKGNQNLASIDEEEGIEEENEEGATIDSKGICYLEDLFILQQNIDK